MLPHCQYTHVILLVVSHFKFRIYIGYGLLKVIPISGFGGIDILAPKKKTPKDSLAFITSCRIPTRIFCVFQQDAVLTRCTRPSFMLRTLDPQGKCSKSRLCRKVRLHREILVNQSRTFLKHGPFRINQ